MIKKWILCISLFALTASTNLFALANAPIQRIDVVNLLSNNIGGSSGLTDTNVVLAFSNGGSTPCFTTTLAFKAAVTVLAGIGQACVAPISDIAITPLAAPIGLVYVAPTDPSITTGFYSSQMVISQLTPPVFDPSNGTLLATGTVIASITNHYTRVC